MTSRTVAAFVRLREQATRELRDAQDRELEARCRTKSGGFRFDLTHPDLEDIDHDAR